MMQLPVTYIFTHDSINVGQDGPTHQPIEQLAMLRSTPNLMVFRPADIKELVGCWNKILHDYKSPAALVISRNEVATLKNTDISLTEKGAYIVRKERENLHAVIIATGTEVQTALLIAEELYSTENLDIRVVSMPIMEEFIKQSEEYQESILPFGVRRIVIEAGTSYGWHGFVYNPKYLITLNNYGVSGTRDEVLSYASFMYNDIKERVIELLK
jgi:transketolase